ncbi:MAG: C40 family peptidase [Clostridium sp.]|uniref:C40 family peptidase n=1 Tax=Clostridium sp. TaxID=1506 RepID=UPI003031C249
MRKLKSIVTKILLLGISFTLVFGLCPMETKAEVAGNTIKAPVLKTSQLKVSKTIVAESPKVEEKSGQSTLSRGSSSKAFQIIDVAYQEIGDPYVWGATGPNGFDCSGLMVYIYGKNGISLPRTSESQINAGRRVSQGELAPGDMVFFNTYAQVSHVGIYIGNGQFIHAGSNGVAINSIYESYYSSRYCGATRVL